MAAIILQNLAKTGNTLRHEDLSAIIPMFINQVDRTGLGRFQPCVLE
jgi:hypothetical protein